jgi:hypothetical protein
MKSLISYLICFIFVKNATAQKTEYFEFSYQEENIVYSVFDSVEFVDSRINQDYIGITEKGANNKLVPIWLHARLSDEINALIDAATKNVLRERHTILINFRNFFINEPAGLFEFHVECYAKWDNEYWLVYRVDSAYRVKDGNIKDKLRKKINNEVADFITDAVHLNLSKKMNGRPLSIEYISDIDNNEKKELPVFTVRKPEKGVYYSFDEFKNNRPRLIVFNVIKGRNELKSVLRLPIGNKLAQKIPRDSVYAVCDGEDTWIAAPNEYAMLNKRGADFFFRATSYENNKIEEVSLATYFFGIGGGIIAAIPRKAMFEFRLNHINGKFILLRRAGD